MKRAKRRIAALTLALSLLLVSLLPACGKKDDGGESGNAQAGTGFTDTLWGKEVSFSLEEIPVKETENDDYLASALSPDGKKVLVTGVVHPAYLLDLASGETTPLTPANDVTRQILWESFIETGALALKDKEQRDAFMERYKDAEIPADDELMEKFFSAGRGSRLQPSSLTVSADTPYLVVSDYNKNVYGVVNTETGALSLLPEGGMCCGVRGEQMLSRDGSDLIQYDIAACERKETVSFAFAMEESCLISAGAGLPDGGLAAIVFSYSSDTRLKNGVLAIVRPDGAKETIPLGGFNLSSFPETLYSADGRWFALQNTTTRGSVILAGSDGVSVLGLKGNKLISDPLDACLNEEGDFVLPEGQERLITLAALGDGQTLLCADDNGAPLLLRPGTMEIQPLLKGGDGVIPTFAAAYTGNGYDQWLILETRMLKNQRIVLTVK